MNNSFTYTFCFGRRGNLDNSFGAKSKSQKRIRIKKTVEI